MIKSFLFLLSLIAGQITVAHAQVQELNIYSFRKYELIKPVLERFEQTTGVKVNLVNGKSKYLLTRLKTDAQRSQADVVLSSDLAQLHNHIGLFQPIQTRSQWQHLPKELYDEQGYWVSVSMRSRALFSLKNEPVVPTSFAQLSTANFSSSFCVRDWQHSYNLNLSATLLATGADLDSTWLKAGNKLLAKRPSGGDRDQLRALAQGHCKYALANHYYWHMMQRSENKRDRDLASNLEMHFLKTQSGLTPISTSTAAIAKYAPNKRNAELFIDFLLSADVQLVYAKSLHEYPVRTHMMAEHVPFKPNLKAVKKSLTLIDKAKALLPSK